MSKTYRKLTPKEAKCYATGCPEAAQQQRQESPVHAGFLLLSPWPEVSLMGSELSSSHTASGQENPPLLTPPSPFSLPPSQPQGMSPALTNAEQIALALPITCPQRPAPRQSKGVSLGTATTRFLLQGDQRRRNTLNHCKGGKRSVMLLSGTSLLSWKAGNTQLHHFHWLSTPQEAGVQLGNTSPIFQYC